MATTRRVLLALVIVALSGCTVSCMRPGVEIRYSPALDAFCGLITGSPIRPAWKTELHARLPAFRALWREQGAQLVDTATRLSSLPVVYKRHTVRLTLCNLPSQSIVGTSVNMRYALRSFTPNPVPLRYKMDTVFHELLHDAVGRVDLRDSPLLRKHPAEHPRVRNHLHLLALQKAALLTLGQHAALANVIAIDSRLPGGHYRRAWQIVNATDNAYLAYVHEIRTSRRLDLK